MSRWPVVSISDCVCGEQSVATVIGNCFTVQYIPRNMHTVFALLCFVVVIHWLIFRYPSSLLHWHCGNLTIAPVPAKQPWWIWINTSCELIMNDCITTTKQSTANRVHISWVILYMATLPYWFDYYPVFVGVKATLLQNPSQGNQHRQYWLSSTVMWSKTYII